MGAKRIGAGMAQSKFCSNFYLDVILPGGFKRTTDLLKIDPMFESCLGSSGGSFEARGCSMYLEWSGRGHKNVGGEG